MASSDRRHQHNLECRDPVYGFVYLSKAEWAVIDCPTFQRLRDIRQLAMAHLVYPGATHTRFEHSLGCLHLSGVIYQAVRRQVEQENCPNFAQAFRANGDQEERGHQLVRLAGLLHDLGHTPFSHTGEGLMPEIESEGKKHKVAHEDMTARLIRETEIAKKLEAEFGKETIIEEVIAVATKPELAKLPRGTDFAWYRFLNDILAGELGSDRMDYLLRDAVHSGQSVGVFDYRKLIDSMTIVPPPEETDEDHRLGLDEAGWLVAEQMVAARYLMYVALYFHKTKRIYEIHLEDFLTAWLTGKYGQPHFPVDKLLEYARLTDSRVWAAIHEAAQGADLELRRSARPFVDRTHLRLAYELLLADNFLVPAPGAFAELLKRVQARLEGLQGPGMAPDQLIAAWDESLGAVLRRRHPRVWDKKRFDKLVQAARDYVRNKLGSGVRQDQTKHQAVKFFGPADQIWVYIDGKTRYLGDLSEIVCGMPERIWRGRIYADDSIRKSVKSFCEKWLSDNPSTGGVTDVAGKS